MTSAQAPLIERDYGSRLFKLRLGWDRGSLSDPRGKSGLHAWTAKAWIRGTKRQGFSELKRTLEGWGVRLGVESSYEWTELRVVGLVENFEKALGIVRELREEPAFDPDEWELLKPSLESEISAAYEDLTFLSGRALMRGLYGLAPSFGTLRALEEMTAMELARAYSGFSALPARIGLVTPGEEGQALAALQRVGLGQSVSSAKPDLLPVATPALFGVSSGLTVVPRPGPETCPFFIASPGVAESDPDRPRLGLANFGLGGDYTARLMQVLRVQKGWTYGGGSGFHQLLPASRARGLFSLYSFPSSAHGRDALIESIRIFKNWLEQGLTDQELNRARDSALKGYPFLLDTAEKRLARRWEADRIGRPLLTREALGAVIGGETPDSLRALIQSRFSTESLRMSAVVPEGQEDAWEKDFRTWPELGAGPRSFTRDSVALDQELD